MGNEQQQHRPAASGTDVATTTKAPSLIAKFAARFSVDPNKLMVTLKATAFKVREGTVTDEQMMALLVVADQYKLNPFTREIFAFPDKQNGIVPVVSVDGWTRIINQNENLDGIEFVYSEEMVAVGDARFPGLKHPAHEWIECVIHHKDRSHPTRVREYLDEVYRAPFKKSGSDYVIESAWQTHTRRFHRHKTLIQASRVAFGFAGIYDEDEAERIRESSGTVIDGATGRVERERVVALPKPKPKETVPGATVEAEPSPEAAAASAAEPAAGGGDPAPAAAEPGAVKLIGKGVLATLRNHLTKKEIDEQELCHAFGVKALEDLPADKAGAAGSWVSEYQT